MSQARNFIYGTIAFTYHGSVDLYNSSTLLRMNLNLFTGRTHPNFGSTGGIMCATHIVSGGVAAPKGNLGRPAGHAYLILEPKFWAKGGRQIWNFWKKSFLSENPTHHSHCLPASDATSRSTFSAASSPANSGDSARCRPPPWHHILLLSRFHGVEPPKLSPTTNPSSGAGAWRQRRRLKSAEGLGGRRRVQPRRGRARILGQHGHERPPLVLVSRSISSAVRQGTVAWSSCRGRAAGLQRHRLQLEGVSCSSPDLCIQRRPNVDFFPSLLVLNPYPEEHVPSYPLLCEVESKIRKVNMLSPLILCVPAWTNSLELELISVCICWGFREPAKKVLVPLARERGRWCTRPAVLGLLPHR